MSAKLTIDTSQIQRAFREYARATGKDGATIINKFGGDVALTAISQTKKASLSKSGVGKYSPKGKEYEARLHYAKAAKGGAKKGDGMKEAASESYAKGRSSTGYHKAGWINAARDLGKQTRTKPIPGLTADKGYGTKARSGNLTAWIYNFADGADKVPEQFAALQRAVNIVAKRELAYAQRKLQQTANRYRGR